MRAAAALFTLVLLAGCAGTSPPGTPPAPSGPWFVFDEAVVPSPSPDGFGSEPSILATQDGSLYIVSVLGSAQARGDGLWKSRDLGATWAYLGKPDYPFGGGDADLDEDTAGTIYLPGQWRPVAPPPESPLQPYVTGGESMAVSKDGGATWTTNPIASDAPVTDRQWTATYGAGNAWLAFNQAQTGLMITASTDSGLTWTRPRTVPGTSDAGDGVLVAGGPNGIPGDILADPKDGTLFVPYAPSIGSAGGMHRLFVSEDQGVSFTVHGIHVTPEGERPSLIFGTIALDTAGNLYYAWAETTGQQSGSSVFLRISSDRGTKWSAPILVSPQGMSAVFPWIVAGSPGHVAVGFYGATGNFWSDEAPAGTEWYPVVALSRDARDRNATFELATLSKAPNHKGPICTGGTGCGAGTRNLGDFFELGLTPAGQVVAVWADDTGTSRTNVVVRQAVGSLLEG